MSEVIYSINGKYFKDFGIYVSSSDGLFDALKRKKVNSYDWAEYHGESIDLSDPKFEAREISLKCFVVGSNWEAMKSNFDAIVGEFQKAGTQRLLIEPLGLKALPYEVYTDDSTPLKKTFRDGKMVGTFTLKLIEPNPIKKVLYFTGDKLNLSYSSPNETEIFYGNGGKEIVKGNASLSGKPMIARVLTKYGYYGRNLWVSSELPYFTQNDVGLGVSTTMTDGTGSFIRVKPAAGKAVSLFGYLIPNYENRKYSHSIWIRHSHSAAIVIWEQSVPPNVWTWIKEDAYNYPNGYIIITATIPTISIDLKKAKVEKGSIATPWTISPEEERYVIIAGDIDAITNVTTNADVLWDKL